jgi:alpha-galactosidase
MPPWYLKDPETVRSWKFGLTTVQSRVEKHAATELFYGKLLSGEEMLPLKASGEEEVRQLKGLIGLEQFVTNINVPNVGQMKGIPLGAVVETNAVFSANSLRPVYAGELPMEVNNLVLQHTMNQELILKAALQKDKDLAFKAFINDPLVNIDIHDAEVLFDQMLQNTKTYLPGWNI